MYVSRKDMDLVQRALVRPKNQAFTRITDLAVVAGDNKQSHNHLKGPYNAASLTLDYCCTDWTPAFLVRLQAEHMLRRIAKTLKKLSLQCECLQTHRNRPSKF